MRTLDALPSRSGRPAKYDWDGILNGDANLLTQGEDFDCEVSSFVSQARRVAADRDLSLEARTISDTEVALQASPREDEVESVEVITEAQETVDA